MSPSCTAPHIAEQLRVINAAVPSAERALAAALKVVAHCDFLSVVDAAVLLHDGARQLAQSVIAARA